MYITRSLVYLASVLSRGTSKFASRRFETTTLDPRAFPMGLRYYSHGKHGLGVKRAGNGRKSCPTY